MIFCLLFALRSHSTPKGIRASFIFCLFFLIFFQLLDRLNRPMCCVHFFSLDVLKKPISSFFANNKKKGPGIHRTGLKWLMNYAERLSCSLTKFISKQLNYSHKVQVMKTAKIFWGGGVGAGFGAFLVGAWISFSYIEEGLIFKKRRRKVCCLKPF